MPGAGAAVVLTLKTAIDIECGAGTFTFSLFTNKLKSIICLVLLSLQPSKWQKAKDIESEANDDYGSITQGLICNLENCQYLSLIKIN